MSFHLCYCSPSPTPITSHTAPPASILVPLYSIPIQQPTWSFKNKIRSCHPPTFHSELYIIWPLPTSCTLFSTTPSLFHLFLVTWWSLFPGTLQASYYLMTFTAAEPSTWIAFLSSLGWHLIIIRGLCSKDSSSERDLPWPLCWTPYPHQSSAHDSVLSSPWHLSILLVYCLFPQHLAQCLAHSRCLLSMLLSE